VSAVRLLYTLMLALATPLILARLAWRARRQPEYLRHLRERFGFYGMTPSKPIIWIHSVSVGETRAAAPLIARLQQRFPEHQVLLTHMTPTGRETGRQLFGDKVLRCYLPYDFPLAAGRFLAHFRPDLGVLMETEIWPNLLAACSKAHVPIALVNGRLSEKSARRYRLLATLARESFARLDRVCAISAGDAVRLSALGARDVSVLGNLKFDIAPPDDVQSRAAALRTLFGPRPTLLLASTREGEETLLLQAFGRLATPRPLLVIVPRHPQRFDEVAGLIARHGFRYQKRSANEAVHGDTEVVLGDSMGEMFAYYGAADIAFVGGSLLPYGGQNLIEACAMGTPVLVGPHTFNFEDAARQAIEQTAARRVADADALMADASGLLEGQPELARMGQAGRAFWQQNQGATERTVEVLAPFLEKKRSATIAG
jgi:3-deoxy-D-manno-octulosonic-acid transferase